MTAPDTGTIQDKVNDDEYNALLAGLVKEATDLNPEDCDGSKSSLESPCVVSNVTTKNMYAGIRGSVADTGVSYLFQVVSTKDKGNRATGADVDESKATPWMIGLTKSLGGGASVHFEHANPDKKGEKSVSYLALKVDF